MKCGAIASGEPWSAFCMVWANHCFSGNMRDMEWYGVCPDGALHSYLDAFAEHTGHALASLDRLL
jgi:hypothetical protein